VLVSKRYVELQKTLVAISTRLFLKNFSRSKSRAISISNETFDETYKGEKTTSKTYRLVGHVLSSN
jgi:hypothetical protein